MIFIRTVIENFFSISEQVTWEMENQGLVLIAGENHDSQTADSNGAGKSTLFEALVWCLWGKTTRKQDGDGVVNRKAGKNCKVMVWIRDGDDVFFITRCRKHETEKNGLQFTQYKRSYRDLTQGTPTLTQEKIDNFLKIDYDTFIQGPMVPQGHFKKFSEMSDGEQKAIFDRALQTEVLAEASKEANERVSTVSRQLASHNQDKERLLQDVEEQKALIRQYQLEDSNWGKEKKKVLYGLAKELATIIDQQEKIWEQSQAVNMDTALAASKKELARRHAALEALQRQWANEKAEVKEKLAELRVEWKEVTAQVRTLQGEIRNMENLQGATCPTCGQDVSQSHVTTCLAGSKKDLSAKSAQVAGLAKKIEETESAWATKEADLNSTFSDLTSQINEQEASHRKLLDESEEAKTWIAELSALQRQELTLRKVFKKKQDEKAPFNKMISQVESNIANKLHKLIKTNSLVRQVMIELEHLLFWQYGFSNKGLKSHILASVTPFLNERVQHYVDALTSGELSIEFSTQTTLKSGETREKFSVQVTNRRGADTYAGNSGGEKGRADLSINFVLADLMSSRSRNPYPQRFLDEPFENLDESGVEAVMELLSDLAVDAGSIFVITHLDSMKGLFAKTLKLVKRNGVTTLVAT